jgi:ketosteroid isomerase-like protein
MSANLELVRSIYADWDRGDFSRVEWADPEIEYVSPDGPVPATFHGLAEMGAAWRGFVNAWSDFRTTSEGYRELDDERVLALHRFSALGKVSGLQLGSTGSHGACLFHFRDSKVVRLVLYWDRARAFTDLSTEG